MASKSKKNTRPTPSAPAKKRVGQARKKPFQPAWRWALIPAILGFLLYSNTFEFGYALDDELIIVKHKHVQAGWQGLYEIFTTNYLNGVDDFNDGLYRPLSPASFAIEQALFGEKPGITHALNALFYGLTGFFLLLLLQRMFPRANLWLPLTIALLFIAHPVHTEGVANLKGRDEIFAFLNAVLSALFFLRYVQKQHLASFVLGVLFYVLAFLSKESALTLAVGIPLLLYFFSDAQQKHLLATSVTLLALGGLLVWWRFHVVESMPREVDSGIFSMMNNSVLATDNRLDRLATGAYLQMLYIGKLVFPHPLVHDYSFNQIPVVKLWDWQALVGLALIGSSLYYAIRNFRKKDPIAFGILFYFLTIAVVANVFLYIGATFAERFLFTPAFGFAIIGGVLLFRLVRQPTSDANPLALLQANRAFAGVMLTVLIAYGTKTLVRNSDWKDNLTLYTSDIRYIDQSCRGHYNYGTALYQQALEAQNPSEKARELAASVRELRAAVAIFPEYIHAHENLGHVYSALDRMDSAEYFFEQSMVHAPPEYANGYYGAARQHFQKANYPRAIHYLQKYLELRPDHPQALYYVGVSLGHLGRFDESLRYFQRVDELDPNYLDNLLFLGQAHGMLGNQQEAINAFQRVLRIAPNHQPAYLNLGTSYSILGQVEAAAQALQRAIELNPNDRNAYLQLIQVYQSTGDVQKATYYQQQMQQRQL